MAKEKPPAFQFYPKDFLTDLNVIEMTAEEVGGYMLLLSHLWINGGSLPDDDQQLAKLSKLGKRWTKGVRERVLECFYKKRGKWRNKRCDAELKKQSVFKHKCAEAGRKSARLRTKTVPTEEGTFNGRSRNLQQENQGTFNSSSSSLSSSSLEEKEKSLPPSDFSESKKEPKTEFLTADGQKAEPETIETLQVPTLGQASRSSREIDRDIVRLYRTYRDKSVCPTGVKSFKTFYEQAFAAMENGWTTEELGADLVKWRQNGGRKNAAPWDIWKEKLKNIKPGASGLTLEGKRLPKYTDLARMFHQHGHNVESARKRLKGHGIPDEEITATLVAAGFEVENQKMEV